MEIKIEGADAYHQDEEKVTLLRDMSMLDRKKKNSIQKVISQTFTSIAHLANLLPTGTVLAFQLLAPIFTNQGNCDSVSRFMTAGLVALCGLSCLLLSFTDSFRDESGNVSHRFATTHGFWVIDGSGSLPPELAEKYRLRSIDFIRAFMSVPAFAAVAQFDKNVVGCFYPIPLVETQEILTAMPVGVGVICSMLFIIFPTKRHGIGFPLYAN